MLLTRLTLAVAAALVVALPAFAQDERHFPRPPSINPQLAEGYVLYRMHCAGCHGERGDGRGATARAFDPRPTDLTTGVYKLRSTPSGSLPTDADLMRTLNSGVRGTAMRCWTGGLSPSDMAEVLRTVKSFSPRFH